MITKIAWSTLILWTPFLLCQSLSPSKEGTTAAVIPPVVFKSQPTYIKKCIGVLGNDTVLFYFASPYSIGSYYSQKQQLPIFFEVQDLYDIKIWLLNLDYNIEGRMSERVFQGKYYKKGTHQSTVFKWQVLSDTTLPIQQWDWQSDSFVNQGNLLKLSMQILKPNFLEDTIIVSFYKDFPIKIDTLSRFLFDTSKYYERYLKNYESLAKTMNNSGIYSHFNMIVAYQDARLLSVYQSISMDAIRRPYVQGRGYVLDKRTKHRIHLTDIFQRNYLSQIELLLQKKFQQKEYLVNTWDSLPEDGNCNFDLDNFVITSQGIIFITFSKTEIKNYIIGGKQFFLKFDEIKEGLNPTFITNYF